MRKTDSSNARARKTGRPRKGLGVDWDRFLRELEKLPSLKSACDAVNVSRQTVFARRERITAFKRAMDAALEAGVDVLEDVATRLALGQWRPRPGDEDCEPPSIDMLKTCLRARRPELWSPSIRVEGKLSLGELRALTDEQLFELGIRMGILPEDD